MTRGRPTKAAATQKQPQAAKVATDPATQIADAVAEKLAELLPVIARLVAADTLRSTEKPETVFKRAIDEGMLAGKLLRREVQYGV